MARVRSWPHSLIATEDKLVVGRSATCAEEGLESQAQGAKEVDYRFAAGDLEGITAEPVLPVVRHGHAALAVGGVVLIAEDAVRIAALAKAEPRVPHDVVAVVQGSHRPAAKAARDVGPLDHTPKI